MSKLYFPKHKLCYIKIPKNACSTVIRSLAGDEYDGISPHSYDFEFKKQPEQSDDWKTVTVIRDPYERLISAYLNKIIKPNEKEQFAIKVVNEVYNNRKNKKRTSETQSISFTDFVEYVCSRKDDELDQHWRSQSSFIEGADIDVVLRFSSLSKDWVASSVLKGVDLITFAPHATTSKYEVEKNLSRVTGEYVAGYVIVTGSFPPKHCFENERLNRMVRERFSDDYKLMESMLWL